MREENKKLMICYYNNKPKQKGFMRRIELLWEEKHPTATLDVQQLNSNRYSIIKKHLLSDLELEQLRRLAEQNDTVQEELEEVSDSSAKTSNVLAVWRELANWHSDPPTKEYGPPTNWARSKVLPFQAQMWNPGWYTGTN